MTVDNPESTISNGPTALTDSEIKTRVTPLDELKLPTSGQDCLVVIYSSDARQFGKRYPLDDHAIHLGRGSENTIVLENDSVSRRHCTIEKRGGTYFVIDEDSTNGTYVNDELVTDYQLRRGDQVKAGDTILKFLSGSDMEAQYHETIYRMTIIDGLTGVHNKRYFLESLDKEIPRARRYGRPLTLVMFDIDHFKKINDGYGHLAGDFVLKDLAKLVAARIRADDVLGRYGGEEFGVVLPETDLRGGFQIAEDIRKAVSAHVFEFEEAQIEVSLSCGVAQLDDGMDVPSFIKNADEKLYAAKNAGRNQTVC